MIVERSNITPWSEKMVNLFRGRGQQKGRVSTQVLPETTWADEPMPTGVPPAGTVVITISRRVGSGGAEIGRIVAREAGLLYLDREIINEVARRLGVEVQQVARQDEQTAGSVGHILEAIQSSNPFAVNYSSLLVSPFAQTQSKDWAYLRLTQRVILELATQGNAVIVGRGSQFLLHDIPRTLHIHIFAPLPNRIENVMKRFNMDRTQATQYIELRDQQQDAYLSRYYGSDGRQPDLYHLLLNTGLFPYELAADFVRQALSVAKEIGQNASSI
jgi:cytidylate kinase